MADRRMIHRKIVESDAFYALSDGAQSLYHHLTINADDDGFLNSANGIAKKVKSGAKKLEELVEKRFLLKYENIYVIKHWRYANSLKNDRLKPLAYPAIAQKIWIKTDRGYTDHPVDGCKTLFEHKGGVLNAPRNPDGIQTESEWIPNRTEQKGTEQKGTEQNPEADFQRLISEYPEARIGAVKQAMEMFRMEILSPEDFEEAMCNLAAWKKSEQWNKEGGRYVPNLVNWLDRGQWKFSPDDKSSVPGNRELSPDELEAIRKMLEEDI